MNAPNCTRYPRVAESSDLEAIDSDFAGLASIGLAVVGVTLVGLAPVGLMPFERVRAKLG